MMSVNAIGNESNRNQEPDPLLSEGAFRSLTQIVDMAVRMEHNTDSTTEELIAQADVAMYEDKRSKNSCSGPADARSYAA